MGVDFYACDCCGESKYEEYVGSCTKCGHSICTSCVDNDDVKSRYAHEYGVRYNGTIEQIEEYGIDEGDYEEDDTIDATSIAPRYCPYCNGTEISDDDLLNYLLNKFNLEKDKLITEYLEERSKH
jgi:hypothetical protein